MSDIDNIKGYKPPAEGSGKFLKLANGEEVKVRITSLPVIFQNAYTNPEGEVTLSTRFAFVVWNHEEKKPQIWQTNGATYGQQLSPLLEDDEYGDWRQYDVKISRSGEKAQTRYYLRPGAKRYDLEDEQLDQVGAIDIIGMLKKQESNSSVYWLSEWREMEEEAKKSTIESSAKANREALDKVGEAIHGDKEGDEEIDISSIPF